MQEMPIKERLDYQLQKPKTRDLKTSVGNYSSQHIQNIENQSSSKLRGYAHEHIPHATSDMFFMNQQFAGQQYMKQQKMTVPMQGDEPTRPHFQDLDYGSLSPDRIPPDFASDHYQNVHSPNTMSDSHLGVSPIIAAGRKMKQFNMRTIGRSQGRGGKIFNQYQHHFNVMAASKVPN